MDEKKKENKVLKREVIPLIIAVTILVILVLALVYTIIYKPKNKNVGGIENTLVAEDISVGNANYVCDGKDIEKLKEDASKVVFAYEVLDNYFIGKAENPDAAPDDPNSGIKDVYGVALRVKMYGITDDIVVKVYDDLTKETNEYRKSDMGKNDYAKYEKTENSEQAKLTVRIYVNDDNCSSILLREFEITLPRYNTLSELDTCHEEQNKNRDVCSKFVFNSNSYKEDRELLNKEVKSNDNNKKQGNAKDEKNNTVVFIIVGIIIVVAVGAGVVVMKGRRKHV